MKRCKKATGQGGALCKAAEGSPWFSGIPVLSSAAAVKPLPEERHPYVETTEPEIPVRNVQVAFFISNKLRVYKDLPAVLLDCVFISFTKAPNMTKVLERAT